MSVPAVSVAPPVDRRAQVEQLLGDIFRLAEWPARVELKDAADGGIAVAVHFEGEVPGVTAGKKSYLVDSLQFLVNKVVNRPGVEKRWVTLGIGAFPEPKGAQPVAAVPPPPAAPQRSNGPRASAPRPFKSAPKSSAPKSSAPKPVPREEPEPEVAVTPEWSALGQLLSAKAVKHGRQYAVMLLGNAERAQLGKAAAAPGVKVRSEGEGHFKRLALTPEKPTPMPRKMQFPDDEEDDDEG